MALSKLRAFGFWTIDGLKGKKIKKHYDEIKLINENFNTPEVDKLRATYLSNILHHAITTTPFYKRYSATSRLEDLPVITKTKIRNNFDDFKSEAYHNLPKFKVATSGSTGIPFFIYQDANKKKRNTADTLYFLQKANYKLGERLYDLEVWRGINMNTPTKALLQNLKYIDITRFSDKNIEQFISTLQKKQSPQHLIGFVSAYENICKYLDNNKSKPVRTHIKSIIAISEYLTDYVKDKMQHYFQVPVVSRYSNEEIGILAQQLPVMHRSDFMINWGSYHIELLDLHQDTPAKPGKPGRIVVTDFFNYCMPLLRYDTGDIACFGDTLINSAPTFKNLEGRKMDMVFDTKGELISSFIVYTKFYDYYNLIKQYQFIQTDKTAYTIKLNLDGAFMFEKELIDNVKKDFGQDAKITIEYVDEIPSLSSGKRKKVVNRYHTA